MNTRRITLIVAVVLALGTGVLTLRYLSSLQTQANKDQASVELKPILIASRDIPARGKITPDMLTRVQRPATQVEPGALTDPKQAAGDIALITIPNGSTVTETKVGRPAEVGLTVRLKPGMRAVSIPVDRVKAISGLVQPGDRVDVLAAVPRSSTTQPRAVTIIRGALVLALNSSLETAGATPSPDAAAGILTVTLGVTAEQADLLTMADLNTTLRLALRPPQEPIRSLAAETLFFPAEHPSGNGGSAPRPPEPAYPIAAAAPLPVFAAPAPPVAAQPPAAVTVIDGDKVISGGK